MEQDHLTVELVQAVERNELSPGQLFFVLYRHIATLCPHCLAGFNYLSALLEREGRPDPWPAPEQQEWAERRQADEEQLEARRQAAEPVLAALLALPAAERRQQLERVTEELDRPALAELLLEESLGKMPGSPREALELARLARRVVALATPLSSAVKALHARATAHEGNALRALGQLPEAGEALEQARFALRELGGGELRQQAELDRFEGSLRLAERRLEEAERLLQRAIDIYIRLEDVRETVLTALKRGSVLRESGRLEEAISLTRLALAALNAVEEPRLRLFANHNLASLLIDAGQADKARRLLRLQAKNYASFSDPLSQLRRLWAEARIARDLGEPEQAESSFLAVRDGFLRQGIGFDAALVSLDLAAFYLEHGRTADTQRLAEEIAPVFLAQDVHREAAAALALFQEAARRERLTTRFVAELATFLHAARLNPALAFGQRPG